MTAPPPVPADLDLRDFQFMPLDVLRLRDSDLATLATGEEFKAAVLLWCSAWHQVPAGSVPNNDRWLARQSGAGANWRKVKAEALRGFVEHADGRLYHGVVVEKALTSWQRKGEQRVRTLKARIASMDKRLKSATNDDDREHIRSMLIDLRHTLSQALEKPVTGSVAPPVAGDIPQPVTATKGEGQGEGEGQGDSNNSGAAAPPAGDDISAIVFHQGLAWLQQATGKTEDRCRRLLGKWRKGFGSDEALISALGRAQREGAIEPVSWMEGALRAHSANGAAKPRSWAEQLP